MLSIIISSYQADFFNALEKNIAETCGIPYEIIKIDNPGVMGICEAYNQGAEKAGFNSLLFLHEDVIFKTKNWGERLLLHLSAPDCGVVGLAGSNYVPSAPSGWFTGKMEYNFLNIIQNSQLNSGLVFEKNFHTLRQRVFAIDGVFLAIKKEVFLKHPFDTRLRGFHGYDTVFTLKIAKSHTNYVVSDICLEHFSRGNPDTKWLKACIEARDIVGSKFQKKIDQRLELYHFTSFLKRYKSDLPQDSFLKTLKFIPPKLSVKTYISIAFLYLKYFFKSKL